MEIFEFFVNLDKNFFSILQKNLILIFFISIFSSLFTQAIKKVLNEVFLFKKVSNVVYLIINICCVLVFSVINVYTFEYKNIVIGIIFLFVFSLVLSILLYDYFLKFLFLIMEVFENFLKGLKNGKNEEGEK